MKGGMSAIGTKRKLLFASPFALQMSAFDPKRTFATPFRCSRFCR